MRHSSVLFSQHTKKITPSFKKKIRSIFVRVSRYIWCGDLSWRRPVVIPHLFSVLSAQLKSPSLFVSGGREGEGGVLCRQLQSIFQQERGEGPPRGPRSSFSLAPSRRHDGMGSFEADKCPGRCSLINALSADARTRAGSQPVPFAPVLVRHPAREPLARRSLEEPKCIWD